MYQVPKILLEDFYLTDLLEYRVLPIYGDHATIVWPNRSKEKVMVNRLKPLLNSFTRKQSGLRMGTSSYKKDIFLYESLEDVRTYLEKRGSILRYSYIAGEVKVNRKRKIYNVACVLSETTLSCLKSSFKPNFF